MSRTGPASYPRPVPTGPTTTRRSVNGVELDVIEAGDRPARPIVLSHGFPECAHSWRHQIEPLAAAGYHVLAPDQRGYGRSSAPRDVDGLRHRPPRRRPARPARRHRPRRRRVRRPRLGRAARVGPRPPAPRAGPGRRSTSACRTPSGRPRRPTCSRPRRATASSTSCTSSRSARPRPSWTPTSSATMRTVLWAASGEGYPETPPAPLPAEGTGFLDVDEPARPGPGRAAGVADRGRPRRRTSTRSRPAGSSARSAGTATSTPTTPGSRTCPPPSMPTWFIGGTQRRRHRRPARLRRGDGRSACPTSAAPCSSRAPATGRSRRRPRRSTGRCWAALAELDGAGAAASR